MEKSLVFSKNLTALRQSFGLTQKEAAQRLGIPYQRYNHYETRRNEPNLETLTAIARFFDVSLDELLGNEILITPRALRKTAPRLDGGELDELLDLSEALHSKLKSLKMKK
ncbi:MAG: helix-turn-helix transcriptional regulator [Clostridiales bacterium]|jgi:transcriptional regulator with XRE-family HTH domain|nr:helix-turn-helix transcriptional regulator [Clostridiales bacterium]